MRWIFIFMLSALFSACYTMPTDDYYSTIPMTNNPQVVPQKANSGMMPAMKY